MRTINIGELKAHLSRELRLVRNGQRIVVKDRNTPIATISPIEVEVEVEGRLRLVRAKRPLELPNVSVVSDIDPLTHLLDDRSTR